jgi:hypothetical protein
MTASLWGCEPGTVVFVWQRSVNCTHELCAKCPINMITNRNPFYIHSIMWQYVSWSTPIEISRPQLQRLFTATKPKHKYSLHIATYWRRDSIVVLATGYGLDDREVGVRAPVGSGIFYSPRRPTLGSTQHPTQWVPGTLSPRVKRPERDADHSPPTSAKVKKIWAYTSTPPNAFMA